MTSQEKIPSGGMLQSTEHYGYKKDFRTALPQFIAVSVKNLLLLDVPTNIYVSSGIQRGITVQGLITKCGEKLSFIGYRGGKKKNLNKAIGYGMTLGFTTILIPAVKDPKDGEILHLEKSEISWISSINLIVVPLGCALSGVVTTPIGRRRAMQLVNLPFLVAWLLFHFASSTSSLYGALCLTGLAGGLLEAPVLTYVAEITQPHLRGALSATSSMCIIIGVFTQFLFGRFLYWRTVALLNISFTILSVVSLCFIPESPHWLVSRRRFDEAKKSLFWLRGWNKCSAVDKELGDIIKLYETNTNEKAKVQEEANPLWNKMSCYTERSFLVPFFLVSYAFFVGHFSGMTTLQLIMALQTYAVSIFQMLEAPIDKYYATLILGLVQICGSALCVLLLHYTGKRPLTLFSTAGAGICCLLVASYDVYIRTHGTSETVPVLNDTTTNLTSVDIATSNPYSWMPTVLLMMLALLTHTGIRLLPWILIGEVFSARTRSGGAGLAGAVGYIFGFLTNKMYINMVDSLFIVGTYGLYGVVCLTGSVVFFFILPETEGKKLNDIENHFAGVKRLTNDVYKSKKKQAVEMSKMRDVKGTVNPSFVGDCSKL